MLFFVPEVASGPDNGVSQGDFGFVFSLTMSGFSGVAIPLFLYAPEALKIFVVWWTVNFLPHGKVVL